MTGRTVQEKNGEIFYLSVNINTRSIGITSCEKEQNGFYKGKGLVGAYYGKEDLTNIKEAEILSSLDRVWDDETGHGNSWSAKWEGNFPRVRRTSAF